MTHSLAISLSAAMLLATSLLAGCATRPTPQVDPVFQAVPGGRYECYYRDDDRNVLARGATSTGGQAIIGGAAGGLLGNQFGSGSGRDLATGLGLAAGAAAGAWNAQRMQDNRLRECQQWQGSYPGAG